MRKHIEFPAVIGILICSISIFGLVDSARSNRKTSRSMGSLDSLTKDGVVPDVIDAQPNATIEIRYKNGVKVEQGNELTPTQVKDMPKFRFEADSHKLYTLAKVDPDAPSRKNPTSREFLHYLVSNIPGNHISRGDTLAAYIGAGAPEGTGLHRYVFLVYHQKDGKLVSDMNIPTNSSKGRAKFSIRKFARDNNLTEPIAANFYQAKYDDYVPTLTAQLNEG